MRQLWLALLLTGATGAAAAQTITLAPSNPGSPGTVGNLLSVTSVTNGVITLAPSGVTLISGVLTFSGTASGSLGLTAGASVTTAPTSTVLLTVPTSVTAYGLELPGAQPTSGNLSLTCTAANPSVCTWGGSTISPKIENGVSKCDQYAGSTADVKLNACITDAETKANGNTSGVADARGMGGAQTFSAFVNCGDTSLDKVTVLMPADGVWTVSTQGSSSHYDFNYYSGCTMLGTSAQPTGLVIDHTAANGNSLGVMGPGAGATPGYVNIGGFSLQLNSTAVITNLALVVTGADNTIFHDMNINHYSGGAEGIGTNGPNGNGICCQATLRNITTNAQFSGGAGLDLLADSSHVLQGLSLVNVSLDHPATPAPNFKCTSTLASNSSVEFHGLYEETNKTLNATTMNTIDGCTGVMIDGFYPNDVAGSSTTTMISTTAAVNTNLVVTSLNPTNFNYGGIFVANGSTGVNTLFTATGAWSYDSQPYLGIAAANSVAANNLTAKGTLVDSSPLLGVGIGNNGGTTAEIRLGGSASSTSTDWKIFNAAGLLKFNTSAIQAFTVDQSGNFAGLSSATFSGYGTVNAVNILGQAYTQNAANNTAGKCTMVTATSCTQTISHTYGTPVCIATQQSATLTGASVGCTVSGTTVTVTSSVANSEVWGFWVFGDPN